MKIGVLARPIKPHRISWFVARLDYASERDKANGLTALELWEGANVEILLLWDSFRLRVLRGILSCPLTTLLHRGKLSGMQNAVFFANWAARANGDSLLPWCRCPPRTEWELK